MQFPKRRNCARLQQGPMHAVTGKWRHFVQNMQIVSTCIGVEDAFPIPILGQGGGGCSTKGAAMLYKS